MAETDPVSSAVPRLTWGATGALLVGAAALAMVSIHLAPAGSQVATFWPTTAIALAVVTLSPARRWPALLAGTAAAVAVPDLLGGRGVPATIGHAVIEVISVAVAALLLTRGTRRTPGLRDQEDFVRLICAALVNGAVALAGGLVATTVPELAEVRGSLLAGVTAHVAAILVIVPVALAVDDRWAGGRTELAIQSALLVAASVLTFLPNDSSALTFAPVLLLAWAANRFDLRVAVVQLVAFAVFVTVATRQGTGPLSDSVGEGLSAALTSGALAQGYLICAALLVLPLGIAVQRSTRLMDRITADGKLFRRNFTESLVGMAFLEPDAEGRDLVVVDLNETALHILGGTEDELVGTRLRDLMDVGPDFDATLADLLAGRRDGWRVEGPMVFARGGRVNLQVSALGDTDDDPFFAAQLLDVTAEYDARHGLEVAQQLTSATLDTTNCIIMVTDLEGVVVRVNAATSSITGYAESELLGRKVWDTGITPADAHDVEALFTWPNRSGVPVVRESDATTRSGTKLRVVWNTNIVRDERGLPTYAVMTGIDVTAERTTAGLVNHLMEASLTTAIVGVDTTGRISVANSGLSHLLGYERDELVGEPFHRLLKSSELLERTGAESLDEAFDILVRGLGREGETRARDWTWLTRNGGEQLVSMTLSVAQDAFAAQSGYLCVARDVTEQRHSQELLIAALDKERTAVERLRALDQAKNEFVSTVSHELRTPVTSIVGYTEMIQDGSIVEPLPEQLPLLETINRNGQRLIAMINDLLMLSGLDSETVQWRHDPVDLATIVAPMADAIRPLLAHRRLTFQVDHPASTVPILGDRAQLERVLMNLLSNAVKFTEDGGTITFSTGVEDGQAVVRVSDTGLGIPAEEQSDLFQRFFRSSTAQTRQIQGTGLGLSIVSAIVAGHRGTIDVDSAHMQGSTFTVRLPLARAERLTHAG